MTGTTVEQIREGFHYPTLDRQPGLPSYLPTFLQHYTLCTHIIENKRRLRVVATWRRTTRSLRPRFER